MTWGGPSRATRCVNLTQPRLPRAGQLRICTPVARVDSCAHELADAVQQSCRGCLLQVAEVMVSALKQDKAKVLLIKKNGRSIFPHLPACTSQLLRNGLEAPWSSGISYPRSVPASA